MEKKGATERRIIKDLEKGSLRMINSKVRNDHLRIPGSRLCSET